MSRPLYWTGSGHLDLADPDPAAFTLRDVARNLSRIPRFLGSTSRFYSVAEHALYCSSLAWWRRGDKRYPTEAERRFELICLMHDAAEAFCGDLTRPVRALLPEFDAIEAGVWRAMCARWGLPEELPAEVREIDDLALAGEKAALLTDPTDWRGLPPSPSVPPDPFSWAHETLAARFVTRARELGLREPAA